MEALSLPVEEAPSSETSSCAVLLGQLFVDFLHFSFAICLAYRYSLSHLSFLLQVPVSIPLFLFGLRSATACLASVSTSQRVKSAILCVKLSTPTHNPTPTRRRPMSDNTTSSSDFKLELERGRRSIPRGLPADSQGWARQKLGDLLQVGPKLIVRSHVGLPGPVPGLPVACSTMQLRVGDCW